VRSGTSRSSLSVEIITDGARLAALSGPWSELLDASDASSPCMSPLWVNAWWRVFGGRDGRELRALALRDGTRLVGLAPLSSRRIWLRPGVPIRRLELIPSGEPEADEIASDYLSVLAARGYEQRVVEGFAGQLLSGALGRWDELILPRMSTDSVVVPLLDGALEGTGQHRFELTGGSPYIPLPASWDQYLARLSGSRRRLVRTSLRAFEEWCGGKSTLHVARSPSELDHGMRILRELHEQRWREAGRSGVFASPLFSAFHAEVMPALLAKDQLELMWLVAEGQPVAAIYNIIWNGAVQFYQSGRRMDLPRELRPGVVLHALAIRRSIELGRREYDFLAGGSRYKQDLALAVRPLSSLRLSRQRGVDLARRAYERAEAVFRAATLSKRNP
jgi:CelD/BcsL family acetyltransferase involved in cellulose biosynthesis